MGLRKSFFLSVLLVVCLLGSILFGPAFVLGQQGKGGPREGVYIIKKGDTLWDLSGQFLSDPFLWPKLWQSNQYITNPHWIYPGNPIRFYPFEEVKIPPTKPTEVKPPEVKPPEVKPEIAKKPPVEEKPVEEVVPPVKPPEVVLRPEGIPPKDARWAGFLTKEEFPGVGLLRQVALEIRLPAFAIGGITAENLPEVLASGATRIAVSGAILGAPDPAGAARQLLAGLRA